MLAAVVLLLLAYRGATWGSPDLWPVALGLLGLVVNMAAGYAFGLYVPNRFAIPLFAIVLYGVQIAPEHWSDESPVRYLSPVTEPQYSVDLYETSFSVNALQALWFFGLAGIALALGALRKSRGPVAWGSLVVAAAVGLAGAVPLLGAPAGYEELADRSELISYEPVCEEGPVTVCLHPAFQTLLPEASRTVNEVAAPLADVPGRPDRAEQRVGPPGGPAPDDTISLEHVYDAASVGDALAVNVAQKLAFDEASEIGMFAAELESREWSEDEPCEEPAGPEFIAQQVLAEWLARRAGASVEGYSLGFQCPESKAAVDRFAALDPAERQTWLRENYTDLRAGRLGLEDMP